MGATKMPIRWYVEKGAVFAPHELSKMSKALEATTEILGVNDDEAKRQTVARFIIRLAQENRNLNAEAMRDRAVAALGGVGYSAIPAIPQPSIFPTPMAK
jgi:hypothetical protein